MSYDVIVIGGGAAGLSGALTLARSRRSVLVIDGGRPRNTPSAHSHNYLTRDGVAPGELVALGRDEVKGYGAEIRSGSVSSAERDGDGFVVRLDDGSAVTGRRLLLATGAVDELPEVEGIGALWGSHVLHCPYCHGWEVRDRAIGVLASSAMAFHSLQMWRQLSDDVTLFLNDAVTPDEQQLAGITARGIRLVEGRVSALQADDGALTGVRLAGGELVAVQELAVQTFVRANVQGLDGLGLPVVDLEMAGLVLGTQVGADPTGAVVGVPGVFAAGNLVSPMETLLGSAAAGHRTGAMINVDLIPDDIALSALRTVRT